MRNVIFGLPLGTGIQGEVKLSGPVVLYSGPGFTLPALGTVMSQLGDLKLNSRYEITLSHSLAPTKNNSIYFIPTNDNDIWATTQWYQLSWPDPPNSALMTFKKHATAGNRSILLNEYMYHPVTSTGSTAWRNGTLANITIKRIVRYDFE